MKAEEVQRRVQEIRLLAHDPEAAHGKEKRLWCDVLNEIATGARGARVLAEEALKTQQIPFARWFA